MKTSPPDVPMKARSSASARSAQRTGKAQWVAEASEKRWRDDRPAMQRSAGRRRRALHLVSLHFEIQH